MFLQVITCNYRVFKQANGHSHVVKLFIKGVINRSKAAAEEHVLIPKRYTDIHPVSICSVVEILPQLYIN